MKSLIASRVPRDLSSKDSTISGQLGGAARSSSCAVLKVEVSMNRKILGAFTVAAVMSGGCLNQNLASMRRALPEAKSMPAPVAMLAESQVAYSADRSPVATEAAIQPDRQKND